MFVSAPVRSALCAVFLAACSMSLARAETPSPDGSPRVDIEPGAPKKQPPKTAPKKSQTKKRAAPKNYTPVPRTSKQRAKTLSNLYARLTTATTEQDAADVASKIENIWAMSGSDTVSLLLDRAAKAFAEKRPGLAIKFLDVVVELAPDFSEGWNRRAVAHYMRDDFARALGDLRRTLALDPNHYKALEGLAQILNEVGQKKGALQAYRQLQRVHPFWPQTKENIRLLEREVEGQGI